MIYLDHNATTPIRPEVLDAMMPYLGDARGDPSSSHRFGAKLKGVIETARAQVAELIGASAREIVFAGSATGANNAAIHAALKANPGKRHNVTSAVEHSSVLNYCMALEGHREWTRIHTNQPQAATRRREEAQEAAVGGSGRESAASDSPKDQSRLTSAATRGGEDSPVAILCGPESGPISERLVREAWDEAGLKHYTRLCVIGFAADPKARQFVESGGKAGLPCIHLKATMDLEMGDLLTHMRSSQIFSVCGMPAVAVRPVKPAKAVRSETRNPKSEIEQWQVELLGLDRFDPVTVEADHLKAADVPARFLHTDYSDIAFRVRQSFFLRTGAWENLMNALRLEFEHAGWDHFACTESASFAAGEHGHMAVEVINPRGIELLVAKQLST